MAACSPSVDISPVRVVWRGDGYMHVNWPMYICTYILYVYMYVYIHIDIRMYTHTFFFKFYDFRFHNANYIYTHTYINIYKRECCKPCIVKSHNESMYELGP